MANSGLIALKLALYEVNGSTETFLKNVSWRIPFYDGSVTQQTISNNFTPVNVDWIASGATKFYIHDPNGNIPYDNLRKYLHSDAVDVTAWAANSKKIKAYLINDANGRYITFVFDGMGVTNTNVYGSFHCEIGDNNFNWDWGNTTNLGPLTQVTTTASQASCTSIEFPTTDLMKRVYITNTAWDEPPWYVEDMYSSVRWVGELSSTARSYFTRWMNGFTPDYVDSDNPYWEGGISEVGGGGGNFSEDSDDVDVDQLPTIDAVGTGFATLFTPSKSQLKALADVMWDSNIFTALQNLVENITGMFTSLAIVPFQVTAGNTVEVTWLGLPITELFLTLASQQYYEFDMGSINLATDSRIFTSGSALDYSPYSKLGIFLPFIGYQDLDIDECRDAVIGLKYRIDILSGTCVALISINGNTIYQFTGNCLSQIPITNENMQSLVTDAVNVGIAAAATHSAMGAASADMAAAEGSTKMSQAARDAKIAHAEAHVASSAGQLSSATANAAMGMKPTYGKAGAISASASLLAVKQPYLFLTTPRQSLPDHYQKYCGFPSNITGKLNSFSGFTVVEDIRLNGLVATSPEIAEIYELLKKGVII